MSQLIKIITFLLFTQIVLCQSNIVSGKVTYKLKYLKNQKSSLKDYEDKISNAVNDLSFSLEFNKEQYSFKHIEKMELSSDRWYKLALVMSGGKGVHYGSIKDNLKLNQKESFGKIFIIKDVFNNNKWEIGKETKKIGKYTCRKATSYINISTRQGLKKRLISAWYSSDVPVPFGPSGYTNLPGLILELEIGNSYVYYCDTIKYFDSQLSIQAPDKGEIVSKEEFDAISEKAFKALKKRKQ